MRNQVRRLQRRSVPRITKYQAAKLRAAPPPVHDLEVALNVFDWEFWMHGEHQRDFFGLACISNLYETVDQTPFVCVRGTALGGGAEANRKANTPSDNFQKLVDPFGSKLPSVKLTEPSRRKCGVPFLIKCLPRF
jgi:hypothetical protein